ncbi:hemerythrin domain-containing protein [Sphingomonas flavalba]|uniref:hemerythrin domain-containing protein n=1 Tax=Sphingomonas flavalba TaxID=2559804 RepID=UPI0039DF4F6B
MSIRTILSADHAELERLCADMIALVDRPAPGDIAGIAALRWQLARRITAHLALEDEYIYRPAADGTLPRLGAAAAAVKDELGELYAAYQAHIARWPGYRLTADWATFRAEATALLARLQARIRREDAELYPLLPE